MPFLIDGHNVLFKIHSRPEKERQAREQFISFLAQHARISGRKYVVVFDGRGDHPSHSVQGSLSVWYGSMDENADALIEELVEEKPHFYVLVTADKKLAKRLSRLVQRTESSSAFIRDLVDSFASDSVQDVKPGISSKYEVNYWLKLFGEE